MNILSIFRYNKPQYKAILTYIIVFVKCFCPILYILENSEGITQMRDPPFMSAAIARTVLVLIVLILVVLILVVLILVVLILIVLILIVLILIVLILVVLVLVLVILAVAIVVLIFVIHFAILLAIRME